MKTYLDLIAEMSADLPKSLRSFLSNSVEHLLKVNYSNERSKSRNKKVWPSDLAKAQNGILDVLEKDEALKRKVEEWIPKAYRDALRTLVVEDEYKSVKFPADCEFSVEQIVGAKVWEQYLKPKLKAPPKKKKP